jgi:hypothetical protein
MGRIYPDLGRLVVRRPHRQGPRLIALAILLLAGMGFPSNSALGAVPAARLDRQKLKEVVAGYLVNIANHITWPDEGAPAAAPLTIAILGRDPFGPVLDVAIAGKTVAGRPLQVVRVERLDQLGPCHVVFMDEPSDSAVAATARAVAGRAVLLVAFEAQGGGSSAGVDLLITKEGTVRYKLAVNALKRAGLVPSSGLLQHALRGAQRD